MSVQRSYNAWSVTYDSVENPTRDLEKLVCRETLSGISFETVIEIGCGTGKNTEWVAEKAKHVTAVDLSEEMLVAAREKIKNGNVEFKQADVKQPWDFSDSKIDLITCSLVLEHVQDLNFVFDQAAHHLNPHGYFYICELHPFKQYAGGKARFETEDGLHVIESYTHNISDYLRAAANPGLLLVHFGEWFDDNDRTTIPRLVSFVFQK
jgi:ubiquinone/menaquinone biosynthesis C-methylase UbiE